ncbi:hypothetical protein [Streptomyces sp. NPDC101132]|uniref:hypothetical protein n=1 Tax=Streptomyces sp. NPDC101132 TaxID=3366110 RepID=UPI00381B7241
MSIRQTMKVRGGAAAVAMAAALTLTLAGCGGGDDGKQPDKAGQSSAAKPQGSGEKSPDAENTPDQSQVLATAKGDGGVELIINSANRDQGGFLTVSGSIKNSASENYNGTSAWRGNEEGVSASGDSVAGAMLTDSVGKKRYYVLRDTDGKCLCTMGLVSIKAGQSVPFFAQFPAPPEGTAQVDFQLPTFATATIKISG